MALEAARSPPTGFKASGSRHAYDQSRDVRKVTPPGRGTDSAVLAAASIGGLSVQAILALVVAGGAMVRFNRPLARAHAALFAGSKVPPRRWQLALLRLLWLGAGAAVFVIVAVTLVETADV